MEFQNALLQWTEHARTFFPVTTENEIEIEIGCRTMNTEDQSNDEIENGCYAVVLNKFGTAINELRPKSSIETIPILGSLYQIYRSIDEAHNSQSTQLILALIRFSDQYDKIENIVNGE